MSNIVKSFYIVSQSSFLSSILILGILFFLRDNYSNPFDDEKLVEGFKTGNSSSQTNAYFKRSVEWINHVLPMFVGEDMHLGAMAINGLFLEHQSVIVFFLVLLLVLEGLSRMTSKSKVAGIGVFLQYVILLLVMACQGPIASHLKSLKIVPISFLFGNFKLMAKVEVIRLILKQFLSGKSGLPSSKVEMLKTVVKRRKQYFDCVVHETKQLAMSPFAAWIFGLFLHIMLLTETTSLFEYDFIPDLHMPLPNKCIFKHLLIILFELDHILMINAILKLSWMAGVALTLGTFILQFRDVRKSSAGNQVDSFEILQDVLGIDVNRTKLWRVFIGIMVCAVTPWIIRISIGFGHYFMWDMFGGTSSSIFWFGQIYLHLFCIAARLRIFSHLICFGMSSSSSNYAESVDDNEQIKEWEDYLKIPRI